jgi:acyl carrier protein
MQPTDTDLISTLAEILSDIAGVDPAEVTADKRFGDDLDLDSLSMVELGVAVEERLGVQIPEEEASQLVTVGDMAAYLERTRTGA